MMRERVRTRGMVLAGLCFVATGGAALWGLFDKPEAFLTAWLAAFYFWVGVPVGAVALLLIHDLTGGAWERTARPTLVGAAMTLPLFVLLFLPIAMALPAVYAWARAADSGPLANGWYLNPGFFIARAAAYFVIWMVFAAFKSLRAAPLPPFLAGLGVILLGVSVAFASIDWLMSVEPHWFSTIYPMIAGASQFIAAMAVVLLVVAAAGPLGIAPEAYRDDLANLATLLLAVVIFWMYTSFCQYLIVWEENLTDEIGWYIERSAGPWGAVAFAVIGAQFVIPFIGLVTTPAKRSRMVVGGIAALLIVADLVQIWWLALPPFHDRGFTWLAPVAAAFIGSGLVLAFFLAQWTRQFPAFAPATEAGHG